MKKTLFISDLHLDESRPESAELFINLLNSSSGKVESIYILGDLFESWIGDDDNTNFNQKIIQSLKSASDSGIKLYFMHGNRDFLIGKRFARESGCQILKEEEKINLYGEDVLLMHGDTLCTDDKQYMRWRKLTNCTLLQKITLLLPLSIRQGLADKLRASSKQATQSKKMDIMDVSHATVQQVLQKHQCNTLIHGHTHKPDIHHFQLNDQQVSRIVLGDWHHHISMLVWDEQGNKNLVNIPQGEPIIF